MARANLVLVISFAKAGTHLVGELFREFGYRVHGPVVEDEILAQLDADPTGFPPDTCILLHDLDLYSVTNEASALWYMKGVPAMFLNYRDPRDVLCSYVRFLMRQTQGGTFAPWAVHLAHSSILHSLPDHDARLLHAIRDTSFPYRDAYLKMAWMYLHPLVCKVQFERLVGSAGGGSDAEQEAQVAEVMKHLSMEGDPAEFARKIFRRDIPVFSKGQIGSWREELKPEHIREFNDRYRLALEIYGYEVVEA